MIQKIAVMRTNFDRTDWKRAFAEALMVLQPDMNPDRADELSDGEYLRAKHVEPAVAARRWVEVSAPQATNDATGDTSVGTQSGRGASGTTSSAA